MKYISVILSLLLPLTALAQQLDSSKAEALSDKLVEYYRAIERESLSVQKQECDFLIETASDSLVRQFVAQDIYRHFLNSPLMGAENVAVHVFDRWFLSGLIKMNSSDDFQAAQVYADFNRQSLIGELAPSISMETIDGTSVELFGPNDTKEGFRILFFYDTECAVCKVESVLLANMLIKHKYPVELCAIYVGDNRQGWIDYISERFSSDDVVHLWDPELMSDFQRKYGVTKTPRMFLVGPGGMILGRSLDVHALEVLLENVFSAKVLEYGGKESEALFDGIFSISGGRPSEGEVKGIADYITDKTLASGDTLMFRQMAGDYLYYLVSHVGEGMKEGLRYHIDRNILSQDKVWVSPDDSLKVVGMAKMMKDLLSKSLPGSKIVPVKVQGELYTWKVERSAKVRLDRLKGRPSIIIFYTEGCEICAAEKLSAMDLLSKGHDHSLPRSELNELRGLKVFMVNVDRLMADNPSLASTLMDAFDLSSLPYIIMTDRDGVILRRYISLQN